MYQVPNPPNGNPTSQGPSPKPLSRGPTYQNTNPKKYGKKHPKKKPDPVDNMGSDYNAPGALEKVGDVADSKDFKESAPKNDDELKEKNLISENDKVDSKSNEAQPKGTPTTDGTEADYVRELQEENNLNKVELKENDSVSVDKKSEPDNAKEDSLKDEYTKESLEESYKDKNDKNTNKATATSISDSSITTGDSKLGYKNPKYFYHFPKTIDEIFASSSTGPSTSDSYTQTISASVSSSSLIPEPTNEPGYSYEGSGTATSFGTSDSGASTSSNSASSIATKSISSNRSENTGGAKLGYERPNKNVTENEKKYEKGLSYLDSVKNWYAKTFKSGKSSWIILNNIRM